MLGGHRRDHQRHCSFTLEQAVQGADRSRAMLLPAFGIIGTIAWMSQPDRHSPDVERLPGHSWSSRQHPATPEVAKPHTGVVTLDEKLLDGDLCNSGDVLDKQLPAGGKIVWYFRHGQSAGNVAKIAATEADRLAGGREHTAAYEASLEHIDTPLSQRGLEQAKAAKQQIATWKVKPTLIICSSMTRAIQTAAILFEQELREGTARLVIRPEVREFYPENNENRGRPVAELSKCRHLQALSCWPQVAEAMSDDATREWRGQWDGSLAQGGGWQRHCGDLQRLRSFQFWLAGRPEQAVAVVAHFGAINNLVNLEPWAESCNIEEDWRGVEPPCSGGLAKGFGMANCSWIALIHQPR